MFKFNKDYEDLDQVKQFYDEFITLDEAIEGRSYNSMFEGKIAGLAGDDEKTGIYLLQRLKTRNERYAKIDELLKQGYKEVEPQEGGAIKFESVVKVGNDWSEAGTNEYPKARIWFAEKRMFIVPKGNRTRGYNVYPGSVVLVK